MVLRAKHERKILVMANATETKPVKTNDEISTQSFFANVDAVKAELIKMQTEYSDFNEQTVLIPGVSAVQDETTGETNLVFDEKIYTDDMVISMRVLKERAGKGLSRIKAIVIGPIPNVDKLLETEEGLKYAREVLRADFAKQTVGKLSTLDDLESDEAIASIPTTIAQFLATGRAGAASAVELFDMCWKAVAELLKSNAPIYKSLAPSKNQLFEAMQSASYASSVFAALENVGNSGKSLFDVAIGLFIQFGKHKQLDTSFFDNLVEARKTAKSKALGDVDFGKFDDFDALTKSLAAPTQPTEPTPAEATDQTNTETIN